MPKKPSTTEKTIVKILSICIALILVLLPFHAVFTTWLGGQFGFLDVFRVWKELLILVIGVGCLYILVIDKKLRQIFSHSLLVQLVGLYLLFSLLRGLYAWSSGGVTTEALLFGLIVNLRYLVFLLVVWLVAQKSSWLYRHWLELLLGPAVVVVLFGVVQQAVLEKDFLRHIGYGPDTIPAYQAVDSKPEYARLQSTLRGANPLGAYLLLIVTTITGLFLEHRRRLLMIASAGLSLVVLFFSYSRSAWLGLVVSLVTILLISSISAKTRKILLGVILIGILVTGMVVVQQRNNDYVQNTVFHSDENSVSALSSNEARFGALKRGVNDVISEPLGSGVGTAGPASARNSEARIAENYYIQLAQEVGIIGLLLYVTISFMVVKELWWRRHNELIARVLLASFAGLTVVNMVSHAWTYDVVSLLWWGLAGVAIARPVILKGKAYGKNYIRHKKA